MTATAHQCTCFGALLHHAQNHLFSFSILSFYFPFKIDRHRLKEINNLQGCTLQGYVWSFLFDMILKFINPFYHEQFWVQFIIRKFKSSNHFIFKISKEHKSYVIHLVQNYPLSKNRIHWLFRTTKTYLGGSSSSFVFYPIKMDCGSEQSFVVNRVATSGDTIPKISPDRASTKSHSTSSSSSAIGGHEKKMPFLIGVAGGTASGKVVNCKPRC